MAAPQGRPRPAAGAHRSRQGGGSPQLYYHDCSGRIPGHTTRAPPVGFEPETNGFQFYAIANLDKTSLRHRHWVAVPAAIKAAESRLANR